MKAKTRKVVSRVATALRLAASALRNSDSKMGDDCRRMKARLGKAEGIAATAHQLARVLYGIITRRVPYHEETAYRQSLANPGPPFNQPQNQAAKLGFQLVSAT